MKIVSQIIERKLSDGSSVFDVAIGSLLLPAITEKDAAQLADKIEAAIEAHTNETVVLEG
jgi:hypothetical protein